MAVPLPELPWAAVMYWRMGAEMTAKAKFAMLSVFSVITILFFAPSYTRAGLSLGADSASSAGWLLQKRRIEAPAQRDGAIDGASARHSGEADGVTAARISAGARPQPRSNERLIGVISPATTRGRYASCIV